MALGNTPNGRNSLPTPARLDPAMPTLFGNNIARRLLLHPCVLLVIPFTAFSISATANEVLFSDDFEDPSALDQGYVMSPDSRRGWSIQDGYLVARQVREDHGTVIRRMLPFSDIHFECDFRFQGGKRFNLVFDDSEEKSVHSGHICRVSVSERSITIRDDKTGTMNHQVRKLRQREARTEAEERELERRLKGTFATYKVDLTDGQWHRLSVIIAGSKMTVHLDDQEFGSLVSPGIDHPSRNKYGFTVTGDSIAFDNWRVSVPETSASVSPQVTP